MPELSIIIPTYNEWENIYDIVNDVTSECANAGIDFEIIVVDDDSPDRTLERVPNRPNIVKIRRTKNKGLSQSVVEGFKAAKSEFILVMDADGSHPPSLIRYMYKEMLKGADIVIGSRYMPGGGAVGWGVWRSLVSFGANTLAQVMFPNLSDPVSGFFMVRKSVVNDCCGLRPSGFKILLEILGKCKYYTVSEIPYTFVNRKKGRSKLGSKQIFEYVVQLLDIFVHACINGNERILAEVSRAAKFAFVGISGIFVNLFSLFILHDVVGLWIGLAGLIAIELSIISNFIFNDVWTFPDRRNIPLRKRFLSFNFICVGGMLVQLATLISLTYIGVWYIFAALVGILFGYVWNFILNRKLTWKYKK